MFLILRLQELNKKINNRSVVVFDYYPGVDEKEVYELIKRFNFSLEINMYDIFKDGKTMTEQMKYNLTDDRVFGKMYYGNLVDFIDEESNSHIKEMAEKEDTQVFVEYGYDNEKIIGVIKDDREYLLNSLYDKKELVTKSHQLKTKKIGKRTSHNL